MTHLEDLCARWDALSKGETPTTHAIREAVRRDLAEAPPTCAGGCILMVEVEEADFTGFFVDDDDD